MKEINNTVDKPQEDNTLAIEVVLALPQEQIVIELNVAGGTTVAEAVSLSGLIDDAAGISLRDGNVGVFGQPRDLTAIVKAGDRVEIYRPLTIDPKEARRQRAQTQLS